ncbi:MAG: hypothetical protein MJZ24_11055, partial [Paludibacteraceae bacterium]|nr:hypothetical protein [Paludibacteraceae bacterium]
CYNTGSVNGSEYVGGVCGENGGTVSNCHNTGSVNGSEIVGGVCGINGFTVSNCHNTGSVNGSEYQVGGVCGYNFGPVSNCYNTGSVNGSEYVGGVCGNGGGTVSNCYNTGSVNGSEYQVGGVCGEGGYTNCYFLIQDDGIGGEGEMDKDAFLSGKVAYLLSHPSDENSDDNDEDRIPNPWGQNIGTDTIPVFSDIAVYEYDTNCSGDKAYTNDSELNGATVEHDFSDRTLSDVADNNGLYSYVCKHNNAHLSNDKVIKDYDGANNLELKYDESGDYENNLYVEELNLADGTAFNVPVAFTAKKVSYDRIAAKDTMTIILPYDVPADKVNGSVYTLTNFDGKTLGYSISDGGIKANVPYLLYKQRNGETDQPMVEELKGVVIHSTEAIDTTKVNDGKAIQFGAYAKATYESGEESIEYDYYAYKNGKFTKAKKSITVSPFRAAVRLSKNASASSGVGTKSTRINANELNIVLEGADEVTGVDVQDNVAEFGGKVNVNDVLGRAVRLNVDVEGCLDGLKDGIYVVNGKKVIVKNK